MAPSVDDGVVTESTDDGFGAETTDDSATRAQTSTATTGPRLLSRILVTWIELTVVGITGGLFGGAVGGPVGFVVYLATTLVSVSIVFYNVNELVKGWLATGP